MSTPRGQPPPPAAQPQGEKIVIPERLRAPKAQYPIRFARQMENELQLVLELKAELEGGEKRNLKVLSDTVAEANLIDHLVVVLRKFEAQLRSF